MRVGIAAMLALALVGCATGGSTPRLAATGPGKALPTGASGRAAMVAKIRSDLRHADPAADDAALERALTSIGSIRRELFVPQSIRSFAYRPSPLPIGNGQTISDAYIVAIMTAALKLPPNANVLDVGTGSGYQAAVLSLQADRVTSVEIVAPLAESAARLLNRLGYRNVAVHAADGFAGWPAGAPYDGIVVAAGAAQIPQPLLDQLKPGARLVMPIGPSTIQEHLIVATKAIDGSITRCSLGPASFVPLTGRGERPETMRGLYDRSIPLCFARPIT
jgi:protein-L-isoaspartate(D-aspartate) O-methyltransferase